MKKKIDPIILQDIRHNINNPLTVIALLLRGLDDEHDKDIARQSVKRIVDYVNSLKDKEDWDEELVKYCKGE